MPSAEYLATKTLSEAVPVSGPPPKSAVPKNIPVTATLPLVSTATLVPVSRKFWIELPNRRDQRCVPAAEYFARKASEYPALVSAPPPKSTVPENFPVTITLPLPSTATPWPSPQPTTLPKHRHQASGPPLEYLATKMLPPGHTTPPKSVGPSTLPVTTTLPAASTATP